MYRCKSCAAKVALGKIGGLQKIVRQLDEDKGVAEIPEVEGDYTRINIWEDIPKHAFNKAAKAAMNAANTTGNQRAGEYKDSWATENLSTPFLDATLRAIFRGEDINLIAPEEKRLLVIASMVDVKLSRLPGGYKADTYIDLLNYIAALTTWMGEYQIE